MCQRDGSSPLPLCHWWTGLVVPFCLLSAATNWLPLRLCDSQFILPRQGETWLPCLSSVFHAQPAWCALQPEDWPLLARGLLRSSWPWLGSVKLQLTSDGERRHKGNAYNDRILNYSEKRTHRIKKESKKKKIRRRRRRSRSSRCWRDPVTFDIFHPVHQSFSKVH